MKVVVGQVRYCKTAQDHYTILNIKDTSATIFWHTYGVCLRFIPVSYLSDDLYVRTISRVELALY